MPGIKENKQRWALCWSNWMPRGLGQTALRLDKGPLQIEDEPGKEKKQIRIPMPNEGSKHWKYWCLPWRCIMKDSGPVEVIDLWFVEISGKPYKGAKRFHKHRDCQLWSLVRASHHCPQLPHAPSMSREQYCWWVHKSNNNSTRSYVWPQSGACNLIFGM